MKTEIVIKHKITYNIDATINWSQIDLQVLQGPPLAVLYWFSLLDIYVRPLNGNTNGILHKKCCNTCDLRQFIYCGNPGFSHWENFSLSVLLSLLWHPYQGVRVLWGTLENEEKSTDYEYPLFDLSYSLPQRILSSSLCGRWFIYEKRKETWFSCCVFFFLFSTILNYG